MVVVISSAAPPWEISTTSQLRMVMPLRPGLTAMMRAGRRT